MEAAFVMDTNKLLNTFYRTINCGLPTEMISENGSNFIYTRRELGELVDGLGKIKIKESTANKGILMILGISIHLLHYTLVVCTNQ